MDNLDEFLAAGEPVENIETPVEAAAEAPAEAPAEQPEATSEPIAEEKPDRPRGPDGKFAKKEADVPEGYVPVSALQEIRKELQALKSQPQPQPQQPASPDIFEDPDGYQGHVAETINRAVTNATLNLSEEIARNAAGNEIVDAAQAWGKAQFDANPMLARQFLQQRNPYGFLVEQYKKAQLVSQIGDDPSTMEEFLAWKHAKENPQPTPAPVPVVPDTLADAQSSRGASAEAFTVPTLDQIIQGKAA